MANKLGIFLIVLFVGAIVFMSAVVSVPEDKAVCVKRFDKIIQIYDQPGLAFKVPFLDTTTELPRNALVYNLSPSDVLTMDKKAMTISSYTVWQITDPLKFLQEVVTVNEAERRLDASVYNSAKNLLSSRTQTDAISSRRTDLDVKISEQVREQMTRYGINVIDIQIKQFDLPQDNKQAVYTRMISERAQMAAKFMAEGKEEAEKIRNTADKESVLILSQAKAQAELLKAEGESKYMQILSSAYTGADRAEFYEFLRSMDALKVAMTGDKTLVLPLDSPLTKWFYGY